MSSKPRLSKNLLQMKFMQRSKEAEEVEATEVVQQTLKRKRDAQRRLAKTRFRVEPSYGALEDLVFGRMSFQGFNPEVERWMAHFATIREEKLAKSVNKEMKKDISDAEAAASLSSVARTVGRKFAKKKQRAEASDEEGEIDSEMIEQSTSYVRTKSAKRFRRPVD